MKPFIMRPLVVEAFVFQRDMEHPAVITVGAKFYAKTASGAVPLFEGDWLVNILDTWMVFRPDVFERMFDEMK